MDKTFFRISELLASGKKFALATVVSTMGSVPTEVGSRIIVFSDGLSEGTVGGGAVEKRIIDDCVSLIPLRKKELKKYDLTKDLGMLCGGGVEIFIETFHSDNAELFIFGGGHIAQKLGPMAEIAGLSYTIIDDRPEYAQEELFPGARKVILSPFGDAFSKIKLTKNSYVVIVTYKHLHDLVCLENAIKTDACYIGMIGSRKKVKDIFEKLEKQGVKVSQNRRVFTPVGLELGDGSPGEISVSILAEIIKIKSGGSGEHLRDK